MFDRLVFIELMMRLHPVLYLEVLEQNTGSTCIFGQNQIRLFQHADSPEGHIFQIANRSGYYGKFCHVLFKSLFD